MNHSAGGANPPSMTKRWAREMSQFYYYLDLAIHCSEMSQKDVAHAKAWMDLWAVAVEKAEAYL